ncbi:unnamed protein product [Blepharisma stoltei]|uniref:TmcB/TmcC TPR repeats domain-containing protein n=1 Tax=Blepharisma stoltei TaxID=1481888 RepID=A0AAU9ILZ5_9CILI|nr:unnamed protein product [Blepharisma stoltei]
MEEELIEASNFEILTHEVVWANWSKMLEITKNAIFGSFLKLYRAKKKNSSFHNLNPKIAQVLSNLIISLQIIRLNWGRNFKSDNYAEIHWNAFGYISMDQICAQAGILDGCFIGYSCLIFLTVASLLLLAIRSYKDEQFYSHFIIIPSALISILSTIWLIPSTLILAVTFKYSVMRKNDMFEYDSCTNCNLNFGWSGIFVSAANLFLMLFLVYGNEIFQAELRHTFAPQNLKARAHSIIDIDMVIFSFILPIVYVFLSNFSAYFHQAILIMYPLYIIFKTIKCNPYYNLFSNIVVIARNLGIILTTLGFIIGDAIDDSLIPIIFFWFVNPIVLLILLHYLAKKFKNSEKNINLISNQYEFENHFRCILMDEATEDPEKVLKEFEEALKKPWFTRDKLFIIWQTNFCLYVLKNERLARIRLHKIFYCKSTIESYYQEWVISCLLEKNNIGKYEDIGTIFYFLELEKIKTKDKFLCHKLADFWNEVVAQKPNFDRLEVLANHVSINLKAVNKGYSCLTKKFPSRTACHDLYGTLQINILRKQESGSSMLLKKGSLYSTNLKESKHKSLPFSDSNGFLIISADKSTLGLVVYANSIAAKILKQPINGIVGSNLRTYVPYPYSTHHDKYLKNFITTCTDPEASIGMSHFLQTERGYLVESNFELHFVSLIKHIYFVAIMKPMLKKRECAVLSDNGMIYAHSEHFLQYIECPKSTGRGENMNDLIPDFDFSLLKSGYPILVNQNKKSILFVLKRITKKSTTFNLLLLIHKKEEMDEWNKGEDEWQKELEESWPSNFEWKDFISKEKLINREEINEENLDYQEFIERDNIETVASPALNGSSQSSSISLIVGEKIMKKAQMVLNSIKWSLLISIMVLISINLGILIYIWAEVNHSANLANIDHLASLMRHITVLAHLSRALSLAAEYSALNITFYQVSLAESINILDSLHHPILSDYKKWDYCSSSDIVKHKLIPMWSLNTPYPIYYNLYDMIAKFIDHGRSYQNSVGKNYDYQDVEFFLIVNSLGQSYKILNDSLNGLMECEINRIKESDEIIVILYVIGFSLIGLVGAIFLILMINLHKNYNRIWNFIRKHAAIAYKDLIKSCFDRLTTIHDSDHSQQVLKRLKHQKGSINEKFSKKFAILCSIIIFISFFQNFIVGYVLYPPCKQNLIKRYRLLEAYHNRIGQISEACYWISVLSFSKNSSSDSLLSKFYDFPNANHNIFDIVKRYQNTLHVTSSKKYRGLFSNTLKKQVFESLPGTSDDYFDLGIYSASLLMNQEMIFYAYSKVEYIGEEINTLFVRAWNLQNMIMKATPLLVSNSKSYVNDKVSHIIYMAIIFAILYFLAYFLLYWPAIIREHHKLQKLYDISQLVPR